MFTHRIIAIKRNNVLTDKTTWVDLTNVFLNERRQTHKNRDWMTLFIGLWRID